MTRIITCTCSHDFQDKRYGDKKRVGNQLASKTPGTRSYRCTVCGREHTVTRK